MREQLQALRTELNEVAAVGRGVAEGRARVEMAELTGVKAQLRAKWEENEQLRFELSRVKAHLEQRESTFARREVQPHATEARSQAREH